MPPTESQILTQTLLPPSSLPTILPLKQFTSLFPASQRSSPQIPILYRALQLQRSLDLDAIKANIAAQARAGREQMREFARSRARDARLAGSGGSIDAAAFANSNAMANADPTDVVPAAEGLVLRVNGQRKLHSAKSLCEEMEDAEAELAAELEALDEEARALIEECEGIVDELGGLEMGNLSAAVDGGGGGGGGVDVDEMIANLLHLQRRVRERDRAREDEAL